MEKEKKSIDQFFRESLGDHEIVPSDKARQAFLEEISGTPRNGSSTRRIIPYLALALLISAGTFVFLYPLTNPDSGRKETISQQSEVRNPKSDVSEDQKNSDEIGETTIGNATGRIQTSDKNKPGQPNQNILVAKKRKTGNGSVYPLSIASETKINSPEEQASPATNRQVAENFSIPTPIGGEDLSNREITREVSSRTTPVTQSQRDSTVNKVEQPADTVLTDPGEKSEKEKHPAMKREWYLSLAAQYSPEYMFNTLENGKFINNFGVEGIFIFGNYSVRTGVSLSIGKGTNELAVEYNDFLGSYLQLDSMSFTWNEGINNFLPNYFLSNQNVWDSLMQIDSLKVVKRYTYLQVPLILGYDVFHSEKFSLGFRAGPMVSILVKTKQLSEEYDPGMKKIIKVNNITPEQIDLNWQFMAGINGSLRISRRFLIEMEPFVKYYFNSVYEKPDISKKPWSIGVRAALLIKL